ncbi:MAG TPA: glycine betaine ABC transporter substrate-binding protein [Marinobacterium sp.]|nr:glycine betaine ABC transporter substrate-binding protein [Marinobacterium sp.]
MKKFKLAGIALAVSMSSGAAFADCGKVSIGAMGWASSEAVAALANFVLEQGYGCETTIVPTDTIPAATSLAENGEPDLVIELWVNSAPVYQELVAEGKAITASNLFAGGGEEGWWIPKYLADKHPELMTLEGILANPELVGSRFHNCPVGWGCRNVNDNLKVFHDMEGKGVEVFDHGSGANLAASIAAAFEEKGPWFGYYWGPTAVLGKYPMVRVDLGGVNPEQHALNQVAEQDPAKVGVSDFPSAPVVNAITPALEGRAPEAAAFAKNLSFPNNVLSEMLAWQEENNASADEAAAWMLTTHTDLVMGMVNDDARAKLSKLM